MLETTEQKFLGVIFSAKLKHKVFDDARSLKNIEKCPNKIVAIDPVTGDQIISFGYIVTAYDALMCRGHIALNFKPENVITDQSVLETYVHGGKYLRLFFGSGLVEIGSCVKIFEAFNEALKDSQITIFGDMYGKDLSKFENMDPPVVYGSGEREVEIAMLAICSAVGFKKAIIIRV